MKTGLERSSRKTMMKMVVFLRIPLLMIVISVPLEHPSMCNLQLILLLLLKPEEEVMLLQKEMKMKNDRLSKHDNDYLKIKNYLKPP